MKSRPPQERLLTAKQVADRLNVHVSTVWRLCQRMDNPLRTVHIGERITRFDPADVDALIADGRDDR